MLHQVGQFLSQPWLGPSLATVALALAGASFLRQGRRWRREDKANPPIFRFLTGYMPFSTDWRQGVLDIQDASRRQYELLEISAKKPRDLVLALGHNGDTNLGPDLDTVGVRQLINRKFRDYGSHDRPTTGVSMDVFFRTTQTRLKAGTRLELRLLLKDQAGRKFRERVIGEIPRPRM